MKKKFMVFIFLCVVVMMFYVENMHAVTIHVTTTLDNVEGSLRAAISTANNNNEDDVIYLPTGTYVLNGVPGDDDNISGDLDINNHHKITITGEGASTTIIDGNNVDRVLHIMQGTVLISGAAIQKGKTPDGTAGNINASSGGGIYNNGTLILSDCDVSNNTTGKGYMGYIDWQNCSDSGDGGDGGGIYNTGSLTLNDCTINNNFTGDGGGKFGGYRAGRGGDGGGIYNCGSQILENCWIINNTSGSGFNNHGYYTEGAVNGGNGGGIYNSGSQYLSDCRITHNSTGNGVYLGSSGSGGGIYNTGQEESTLCNCTISNNTLGTGNNYEASGNGGGICNYSVLILTNCEINRNKTFSELGTGGCGKGGGIFTSSEKNSSAALTLTNCTISDNSNATSTSYACPAGGQGGGLYNSSSCTLTNCTISSNCTPNFYTYSDGGDGGGIYTCKEIYPVTLTLTGCTVCSNSTGGGISNGKGGSGGGIYRKNGTVIMRNTIIANNRVAGNGEAPDCYGIINSQGYNLIQDNTGCTLTGNITGNISGVDPLLDSLNYNGGFTPTHALLPGSPAIDAGYSFGISNDQRGFARPIDMPGIPNANDGSDIGAYELDSSVYISGTITYGETGLPGVTLTFSHEGGTAVTDSGGKYQHRIFTGWTGKVTPSKPGFFFTPASMNYSNLNTSQTNQDYIAMPTSPPRIKLNRDYLHFGADTSGHQTGMQRFFITNSGGGMINWTASDNAVWLNFTPASGTGPAVVIVSIDPSGLAPGTYTAAISIEDPNASNSPQTVIVTLTVYDSDSPHSPLGCFDTPIDGSTVMSSIPVSGWVIDNIGIEYVKIYRKAAAGEGSGLVYIGDAVLVEGARPDIEAAYPGYPENYKAGWGYMLLTNMLPNQGNGTFTLYAKTADKEGNVITLGTKTIKGDNAHAVKPFGAIDTPTQGGIASGSNYINFGWALTPLPNTIPLNGSTINVWVDGIPLGNPVYNRYREDIAALFPGYNNSAGAVGYYYLDTGKYENGVHTIAWSVTDDAGNTDGIGCRYFSIQNTDTSASDRSLAVPGVQWSDLNVGMKRIPVENVQPLQIRKGYNLDIEPEVISQDDSGNITIEIKELERLEIHLYESTMNIEPGTLNVIPLPIGAALDHERGIFAWQPGPGYLGNYELIFVGKTKTGDVMRKFITIRIRPKYDKKYQ